MGGLTLILAAAGSSSSSSSSSGSSSSSSSGGSFLITPNVGLMVWTLLLFVISLYILYKMVFPRISAALEKRQHAIEDSIDDADRIRQQADQLLDEYRERLREARQQAEEIVQRARQTAEAHERNAEEDAVERREELLERTRRDIESETRRAIDSIRREVADLTVLATEKVTRKTLTEEDQRRLIDDALSELDFSALTPGGER
jgi:F-type H+-transporting ATPase subunit b